MENRAERLTLTGDRRRRLTIGLAVGLVLLVLIAWAVQASSSKVIDRANERTLVVEPSAFSTTIGVVGTIQPDNGKPVFAPFDGTVQSIGFAYGDRVTAGQLLVTLDTFEIRDRQNAAQADFLKSQQTVAALSDWSGSPDVSRARRAISAASMELDNTNRKIAESRVLLDKGLVPRSEYDGLVQQRQSQKLALAAAREDYAATMHRGEGINARVAALELSRNRARLADLDAQVSGATVRAPNDGIIVRPPRDSGENSDDIHVGTHLNKGQLIGSIAGRGALSVRFTLDETDVNQIRVGQRVSVTGPGFPGSILHGEITNVGGEAVTGATPSATKASFAAVARLDPIPSELAAAIRIGMSGTVAIETYAAKTAIVVPPAAVNGAAPSATVAVEGKGGREQRAVVVGHTAPDGVEILSGLKAGDRIVWTETPMRTPQS